MPSRHVLSVPVTAITRTVTVAAGRFAADTGHLGGLTPFLPFELVDSVLKETRAVQHVRACAYVKFDHHEQQPQVDPHLEESPCHPSSARLSCA